MILLSGLIGALVGAFAALASQFLANYLAEQRDRRRFQIQSFERFRSEFSEDENLRRISIKKEAMTDDEVDDYIGFFEEVGLYFSRGLVDIQLVDEILGDSILDAWNNVAVRKSIGSVRGSEDDPTYFKYFELLARHLVQLKSERIGDQK